MVTTRREQLKTELRAEILSAARDLFVRDGYASTSMRRIADTVGCAPGTLYLYFADKDAILDAICAETFSRLGKRMGAIAHDTGDPLARLRRCGRIYAEFALEHPHHYLLTFGTAHNRQHAKGEDAMMAGMTCFGNLQACVTACVQSGQLRNNNVEEVSQVLWAALHGVVMLLITKGDFPMLEATRLIEATLDICMNGIAKRDLD